MAEGFENGVALLRRQADTRIGDGHMREHSGRLDGVRVAFIGDGNNIAHSLINAAARFPIRLSVASPRGYEPSAAIVDGARRLGADVSVVNDPVEAAAGADYLYTDVWASMQEDVFEALRYEQAVARRNGAGGTGPESVAAQMAELSRWLQKR